MYYNMDEPWENKLVIKVYILYYFHFYKILRIDKSIEIENVRGCFQLGCGGRILGVIAKEYGISFWVDKKMFLVE